MFISVTSQTTLYDNANFFAFSLADATAPNAILEVIAPPKPYGNPMQVTFTYNCISGHLYIVKLWESVDGTATGQVRNSMSVAVGANSVAVRMPEYLKVGETTGLVAGASAFVKASWAGWNYLLFGRGKVMVPNSVMDNSDPDYQQTITGGFSLVRIGDVFTEAEEFVAEFVPQIIAGQTGVPSAPFATARVITADTVLTAADSNVALILQGATDILNITLPDEATLADVSGMIYLFSAGGNHINAKILTTGAARIVYPDQRSAVALGKAENLILFPYNGNFYVFSDCPGIRQVGELVYSYGRQELNTLFCNGQELDRFKYPRLWGFISSLEAGSIVDQAVWDSFVTDENGTYYPNRTKFSNGNGTTTFRVPILMNQVLKGSDGSSRMPGTFEVNRVKDHEHRLFGDQANTDNIKPSNTEPGAITGDTGGEFRYQIHRSTAPATLARSSKPTNADAAPMYGEKNVVDNAAAYCLIRI